MPATTSRFNRLNPMTLRTLHRISAMLIAAFACVHLANHLASLSSVAAHLAFMDSARAIYRQPIVEVVLLSSVAFQVCSGLRFFVRGWKHRRGLIPWLQAASGLCLALFLLVHVGAVLFGRTALELDTNFFFAAAAFHVPPNQYVFAPYYFFAVVAFFTHIGCAAYRQVDVASRAAKSLAVGLPMAVGSAIGILTVLSLAGMIHPVEVPAKYLATYERQAR